MGFFFLPCLLLESNCVNMEAVQRNSCMERESCQKLIWSESAALPAANTHPFPSGFEDKALLQDLLYLLFLSTPKITAYPEPPSSLKFAVNSSLHILPSPKMLLGPFSSLNRREQGQKCSWAGNIPARSIGSTGNIMSRRSSCTWITSCWVSVFLSPV